MRRIEQAMEKVVRVAEEEETAAPPVTSRDEVPCAEGRIDHAMQKALEPEGQGGEGTLRERGAHPAATFRRETMPVSNAADPLPADSVRAPSDGRTAGAGAPVLVAAMDPRSPVAEEYRKLKTSLLIATSEGTSRIFLVTSSIGGEGKSVTASNLAISLAGEYDREVLLIDADMRKPAIGKLFGIRPPYGLSECLAGKKRCEDAVVATGIGNLSVLAAGGQVDNPTELLSSQMAGGGFMYDLRQRNPDRYVIIDAPPILPVSDARILSAMVDGIIFVVREEAASVASITEAIKALSAPLVGIVYNQASAETMSSRYYGYSYAYGEQAQATKSRPSRKFPLFPFRRSVPGTEG